MMAGACLLVMAGIVMTRAGKKHAAADQIEPEQPHAGVTHVKLTGTAGATVEGMYVQNGEIVVVSNSLPWSFTGTNISRLEFQLVKPKDEVSIELVYDGKDAHARMTEHLDAKSIRMEARVENGFIVTLHQK